MTKIYTTPHTLSLHHTLICQDFVKVLSLKSCQIEQMRKYAWSEHFKYAKRKSQTRMPTSIAYVKLGKCENMLDWGCQILYAWRGLLVWIMFDQKWSSLFDRPPKRNKDTAQHYLQIMTDASFDQYTASLACLRMFYVFIWINMAFLLSEFFDCEEILIYRVV